MSKLVKNSAIYALGDIVPRLLSFIAFPILTRYLSPSEYGILNYVNTVNIFILAFGILSLNTYYLVYYHRLGNDEERQKLLGNLTIFIFGFNILLSIAIFFFGTKFFKLLEGNIDFYPYIAIGVATCFFNTFSVLPLALFRLQERPMPITIINIARGILLLATTLILVIVFHFKALGVLYSSLIISFLFAIFYFAISYKNMIANINWKQIKTALKFSLPLLPGTLAYLLISMSDRILIDKYLNLDLLGIYGTASTLALLLNIVSTGAYKAFEPYFFKTYGTPTFNREFINIRNGYFIVVLLGAFGLSLFSKEFFLLFTSPKFHMAYFYVPLIMIGVFFFAVNLLYSTIITARGKTKINSMLTIGGGIISITLNIFLLPRIGLIGATVASGIAMFFLLIGGMYFSRLKKEQLSKLIFLFILSAIIIIFAVYYMDITNIVFSIFTKVILFVVFAFIAKFILRIPLDFYK